MNFQQFFRPLDLFRCGRNGIRQRIRNPQLLPFEETERVIGKNLYPLDCLERRDEFCGPAQTLLDRKSVV